MAKAKSGTASTTPRKAAAPKAASPMAGSASGIGASSAAPAAKKPAVRTTKAVDNGQQFAQPQVVMTATHDQIAKRAYEIWLAKGRPIGQDDQNWREAEADLQTAVQR